MYSGSVADGTGVRALVESPPISISDPVANSAGDVMGWLAILNENRV